MRVRSSHAFFRLAEVTLLAMLLAGWFPILAELKPKSPANPGQAISTVPLVWVEGVRNWCQADQARMVVDLETAVQYTASRLSNPERIYLDLYDTRIRPGTENSQIPSEHTFLNRIRIAETRRSVARIVFDLNTAARYAVCATTGPSPLVVEFASVSGSVSHREARAVERSQRERVEPNGGSHPASQISSGVSVSGVVLDPTEAVVVGAKLRLRALHNHQEQSATTGAGGEFRFDGVAEGQYELQVECAGFKEYKDRLKVGARPLAALQIVLAIAELQETITVDNSEKRVSSDVSGNVDVIKLERQFLDGLPILDQDIVSTVAPLLDPSSVGTNGPTLVIDGMPSSVVGVPASAIQEVRINKNPYSAEFAHPGRGRVEIITKPGSSNYHGSISFGLRDYRLDAKNTFAVEKPREQRRQWDGYLSGPVGKSKNTTFLLSASRKEDDLQAVVNALGPSGPILGNFPKPQRSTYFSAQFMHQAGKDSVSLRYSLFDWSDQGEGVGGVGLPEVAADSTSRFHQVQLNYKRVISPKLLNEFSIRARTEDDLTRSRRPGVVKIVVLDAFIVGGAQADRHETDNRLELTDTLSWSRGKHFVRTGINIPAFSRRGSNDQANFDGTFYFSSLGDFASGRPFSLVRNQGDSHLAFWQKELGLFIQDDVRVLPNLSAAFGLRYDWQNYLGHHTNFAPRLAFAYAPGKGQKTVLRGGAGIFYDTTGPGAISDVLRFDGLRLRQFVLSDPGYPDPLSLGSSFSALPTSIVRFAPNLRSPYLVQYSFGVERQLLKSLSLSATYIGTQGVKMFRSRDINAPPPPLYLSRPDPSVSILRQIESTGRLQSHALDVALRGSFGRFFDGMVMYEWRRAYNDTDGIRAFPANNYDLSGEWSRASFDARHFFYVYGVANPGRFFKLGVVFSASSGRPYSLTTGRDDNRDGFANDRPPGVRRNSLQGPGSVTLDLRLAKDFFLYTRRTEKDKNQGIATAAPAGRARSPGPSVTIALDAFNVLNHVNFGSFVGDLSSPFFGRPVSAGSARRLQASLGLKF